MRFRLYLGEQTPRKVIGAKTPYAATYNSAGFYLGKAELPLQIAILPLSIWIHCPILLTLLQTHLAVAIVASVLLVLVIVHDHSILHKRSQLVLPLLLLHPDVFLRLFVEGLTPLSPYFAWALHF